MLRLIAAFVRAAILRAASQSGGDETFNNLTVTGTLTVGGQILAADGNIAAPGVAFSSEPGLGLWRSGTREISFAGAGTNDFTFDLVNHQIRLTESALLGWSSTGDPATTAADVSLFRDAANILAQRNGANAQTFRVYNTYTSATNNEALEIAGTGVTGFVIQVKKGSAGGSARPLLIGNVDAAALTFFTANSDRWQVDSAGHFIAATDNTYDIGASGATRPRNLYLGNGITLGSAVMMQNMVSFATGAGAQLGTLTNAPTAGNPTKFIFIRDNAQTLGIPAWIIP